MTISTIARAGAVLLCLSMPVDAGIAPPPPPPASSSDTTKFFVGLNWTFGAGGQNVEALAGVAYGQVDGGDVTGAKASVHVGLDGGFNFRKVKLTGLFGDTDLQGEVGAGYDFRRGTVIGVAGVNSDYIHAGADLSFGQGIEGYIGAHSIGDFE